MSEGDPLLRLLSRFCEEGVDYVLVGGQAVRLNGFLRATEDVDVLVRATRENGERVKRALDFLASARDLDPAWFEPQAGEVENIRVADDLIVDLLFAANGETYETVRRSLKPLGEGRIRSALGVHCPRRASKVGPVCAPSHTRGKETCRTDQPRAAPDTSILRTGETQ